MSAPTWLPDWLTPTLELAPTQQFGLAFLLGSFTVARLLAVVAGPLLGGGRSAWPFMPVVTLATFAVLVLGWLW